MAFGSMHHCQASSLGEFWLHSFCLCERRVSHKVIQQRQLFFNFPSTVALQQCTQLIKVHVTFKQISITKLNCACLSVYRERGKHNVISSGEKWVQESSVQTVYIDAVTEGPLSKYIYCKTCLKSTLVPEHHQENLILLVGFSPEYVKSALLKGSFGVFCFVWVG